jgi:hypothetical protein
VPKALISASIVKIHGIGADENGSTKFDPAFCWRSHAVIRMLEAVSIVCRQNSACISLKTRPIKIVKAGAILLGARPVGARHSAGSEWRCANNGLACSG